AKTSASTTTFSPATRLIANRPPSISGESRPITTRSRPSLVGSGMDVRIPYLSPWELAGHLPEGRAPNYSTTHGLGCNSGFTLSPSPTSKELPVVFLPLRERLFMRYSMSVPHGQALPGPYENGVSVHQSGRMG